MSKLSSRCCFALAWALGIGTCVGLDAVAAAPAAIARPQQSLELTLRRTRGRVDVVVVGAGLDTRAERQRHDSDVWIARLSGPNLPAGLKAPQQVLLEASDLLSVRLEPRQSGIDLVVKARFGSTVPKPETSSNGQDLIVSFLGLADPAAATTGRLDLRRPGRVPQPVAAPPARPRAVAPPLGDMAVGTMLINNRSFVQASGPPVTLTLNNSSAKDALMSLARLGGYGFVFVQDEDPSVGDVPVTMAFRDERCDRALNSVLLSSGLQARLDGRTLLVGTAVSAKSFGPQMSKVFRLNQVDVQSAAEYLASLGASMTAVKTVKITSGEAESAGATQISARTSQTSSEIRETETYGSSTGPLLGLTGVTDSRLDTVTLVGDPALIQVAQAYLRQLDLRKRQVAVRVQILNVDLTNDKTIDSSFSARMNGTFLVSDSGKAHMNFGRYKPLNSSSTGVLQDGDYRQPGTYASGTPQVQQQMVIDPPFVEAQDVVQSVDPDTGEVTTTLVPRLDDLGRPIYVPSTDPAAAPTLKPLFDAKGRPILVPDRDPARQRQPENSFFAYIEAMIESSSAKTLAQPTLLVQEGESALVQTGESVITGRTATETANGSTQFQNTRENAGLSVQLKVNKVDDNGFVTLNLQPEISVPISAGVQEGIQIFNISARKLESGDVRLRDGQSLILTGVIQEADRQRVQKWPLLGDLPLIGQLFRQSSSSRLKSELVVIVTPTVLLDGEEANFGYGYQPATAPSRSLVQSGR